MSDIVERLGICVASGEGLTRGTSELLREAATTIATLRKALGDAQKQSAQYFAALTALQGNSTEKENP